MKKYMLILLDLEKKIKDHHFVPGQKMPSVRNAARLYNCSVSTVIRAYAELEKRHEIYAVAQSGFYVVDHSERHTLHATTEVIDFSSASPDRTLFPYLDFQHCLNKAIDTYKYQLFTCGEPRGMEKLRRTMTSHLANDQVFAKPDQIMITPGVQQTLEFLATIPFPNGKSTVLVEQPSYDLYLRFLERNNIPVTGIARSAKGIDLLTLEHKFKNENIKFFYTISRYHNPLGTSYKGHEKQAIASLAEKYDVYIIEDDYMADLGDERNGDPIYAYNRSSHVVYLKSFSKIIFPGLRLGAAVIPESLMDAVYPHKTYADTSLLSQAALDIYIKNGMYERHKHKIYSHYAERLHALKESLSRYDKSGMIEIPESLSGIYVQFKLSKTTNMERLIRRLAKRGINVVSGKQFYLNGFLEQEKFLRISVSRAQLEHIDMGVKAIVEEAAQANW